MNKKINTCFKIRDKYFDTTFLQSLLFKVLCWFYFLLTIPNLGASFCMPKSVNQSQKQSVLPPAIYIVENIGDISNTLPMSFGLARR